MIVEAAAPTIDPDALWWPPSRLACAKPRDQQAGILLQKLREEVLGDPVITTDPITGQSLDRLPVSCTYARAQRYAGPSRTVDAALIDADAIVSCRPGEPGRQIACAGADKPNTVYGALTWLARGRALPSTFPGGIPDPADATLLPSSRIVICGSGGHHRTLACFLWGQGELRGSITVVDEVADNELRAACQLIDSRLPQPVEGIVFDDTSVDGHAVRRTELLELAQRLRPLGPFPQGGPLGWMVPSLDDVLRAVKIAERHPWRARLRRMLPRRDG